MNIFDKMLADLHENEAEDKRALPDYFLNLLGDMRNNQNNFSYWFPHLQNVQTLCVPESVIISVPPEICDCFYACDGNHADTFQQTVLDWVKKEVIPQIPNPKNSPFLFMKNGTFSNKFDASTCFVRKDPYEVMLKMLDLNYGAIMLGAGGITEMVFRQAINPQKYAYPCIYNGLPFRPEFRVFYDFDCKNVLYSVNYWDWDYCHQAIAENATDKIIYETVYPHILKFYEENVGVVEEKVTADMSNVDLTGKWSVDVMYDKISDTYYLIDMARAENSAYWDPTKMKCD